MQAITSKLFSAIRSGIIKSNKTFWDLYADLETIDELKLDTTKDQQYLEENNIKIISTFEYDCMDFTDTIKRNENPFLFAYKGDINLLKEISKNVAVVGVLTPTEDIIQREKKIVEELVQNGKIIVSGLAKGCDTIAHKTCIENGGKTIAILPTTFESIYPKENKKLVDEIVASGGLVITEYVTEPKNKYERINRFIDRDRLQAMFSKNIILVASFRQGEGDSGSRHAMKKAKEYGRNRFVMFNEKTDKNKAIFGLNEDLIIDNAIILTKENIKEI